MRVLEPFVRLNQISGALIAGLVDINNEYGRFAEAIRAHAGSRSVEAYAALGLFDEANQLANGISHHFFRFLAMRMNMQVRGEYEETLALTESYLANNGYVFEEVGPDDQAWILQTQVLGGDHEGAIERFESLGNGEPLAWLENVSALLAPDLLNAMGFAYAQTGDTGQAQVVLSIETSRLAHFKPYSAPIFLEPMALNAALLGDDDLAYKRLSQAVDKGWANYYRTVNDPRWGEVLSQPRFVKLLERVQADLEEQRAEVEAILQDAG